MEKSASETPVRQSEDPLLRAKTLTAAEVCATCKLLEDCTRRGIKETGILAQLNAGSKNALGKQDPWFKEALRWIDLSVAECVDQPNEKHVRETIVHELKKAPRHALIG